MVGKGTVAKNSAQSACGQISGVCARQSVVNVRNANGIVGAMPARSLDRQASLELPVNFPVRVFLVRTVVLAPANPRAHVIGQALLDVHAKTRLHTRGAYIG